MLLWLNPNVNEDKLIPVKSILKLVDAPQRNI